MSAIPVIKDIEEHKKTWRDLFFRMADGDILKIKEIKKIDVMDFWAYLDLWKEKITK